MRGILTIVLAFVIILFVPCSSTSVQNKTVMESLAEEVEKDPDNTFSRKTIKCKLDLCMYFTVVMYYCSGGEKEIRIRKKVASRI